MDGVQSVFSVHVDSQRCEQQQRLQTQNQTELQSQHFSERPVVKSSFFSAQKTPKLVSARELSGIVDKFSAQIEKLEKTLAGVDGRTSFDIRADISSETHVSLSGPLSRTPYVGIYVTTKKMDLLMRIRAKLAESLHHLEIARQLDERVFDITQFYTDYFRHDNMEILKVHREPNSRATFSRFLPETRSMSLLRETGYQGP